MTYTPNRTEAAQRRDEMTKKWKRATVAVKNFGEAVDAFFRTMYENAGTPERRNRLMREFLK